MAIRATVGSSLLLLATACGYTAPAADAPRPITPEDGPSASIRVQFTGGEMYRRLEPTFIVDEDAYVMVGHLGGDGMIRVLWPKVPTAAASHVQKRKTTRVQHTDALYDADPSLFSFASSAPYRTMGAEMDSYDGMGHGFVFMIASRYPLNFEPAMDGREWGEMDVAQYGSMSDPRYAVRRVADVLTGGPYTLEFASAHRTTTYGSHYGCSGYIGSRSWFGYPPYGFRGYSRHSATSIVPIFWGGWMPMYTYVGPWDQPRLSRCGGGGFAYYRVFNVRFAGAGIYPWIEPTGPLAPPRLPNPRVTRDLTSGTSAIERPTIIARSDRPGRTRELERSTTRRPTYASRSDAGSSSAARGTRSITQAKSSGSGTSAAAARPTKASVSSAKRPPKR